MALRRFGLGLLLSACLWAADVTGEWSFAVETSQGSGSPTFVFKQDGEKLTGSYRGLFGTAALTGSVKGDQIEFSFDAGEAGKAVYTGTIESSARMKGKAKYGDLGEATWTGTKK